MFGSTLGLWIVLPQVPAHESSVKHRFLGRGEGEGEERPKQMVCYRAGDETGELHLEGWREGEDLQLAYLLSWLE